MNDTNMSDTSHHQSFTQPSPINPERDMKNYRIVKQENKELGLRQQEVVAQHAELSEKVTRMNENLKKMKYADCNESKINITNQQLNREISKIEKLGGAVQKIAMENEKFRELQRANSMRADKAEQSDYKLKKAEETNKKLVEEYNALKTRVEQLEKGRTPRASTTNQTDLLAQLDRLDNEASFMMGRVSYRGNNPYMMQGAGDHFSTEADMIQEYEFKLTLMQTDLQSVQSENNTLVQTVLALKQELKNTKTAEDEFAVKKVQLDHAQVKREIKEVDDKYQSLQAEVQALNEKVSNTALQLKTPQLGNEYEQLRNDIMGKENYQQKKLMEIRDLKEKIQNRQRMIDGEKQKQTMDRTQTLLQMEKENTLLIQLKERMGFLMNKYKDLLSKSAASRQNSVIEMGSTESPEHLKTLQNTNERLMNEIFRLNNQLKEERQKTMDQSRVMKESLNLSKINFNEQSFDKSFLPDWK